MTQYNPPPGTKRGWQPPPWLGLIFALCIVWALMLVIRYGVPWIGHAVIWSMNLNVPLPR